MGASIYSSTEYITWPEFTIFVNNARRYLEINACVWTPAQQSVLIEFFHALILSFENAAGLNLPWESPGSGWAASSKLEGYFRAVRDAVPKSHFYGQTYPYTLGTPVTSSPPPSVTPSFPESRDVGRLFLLVSFFYGAYVDKDSPQEFLNKVDYPSYVFVSGQTTVDYSSIAAFITGMSQIHFCGKEVTLPPNKLVILQDPAFLLTGRVVQFPQTRDDKCCEVVALHCLQRVNCGIYITKLVRDIFCDVTCRDPCRKCNVTLRQGCYNDGPGGSGGTRYEDPFSAGSSEIEARRAEAIPEREFRERFITIRPFVNSDLLVPQIFSRLGNADNNWILGLPEDFLTQDDLNARDNLERVGALGFNREFPPGNPDRNMAWVPFENQASGPLGPPGGCSSGNCGPRDSYQDNEYDVGYGSKGEKGFRSFRVQTEVEPLLGPGSFEEPSRGSRRGQCSRKVGPCECRVPCFEPPKLAIPVQRVRRIRPITIFGLLIYLVEKLDWVSGNVNRLRDRVGA